ncbi:hypothetical protein QYH69_01435 [Paraburkholderia sp. SARCC-3016]|uniref:hypothetical protein n=1 Tax=Paraburkholderia sp. SARCC-3016 TaxID=3058611 RepID=UPI002808B585|nr:hypothetical protein [Paraburkholderia sp. SARCC-3016]MDQ7975909.1 hypothetical protein [Paraburkholderia sp. SARCC-3016]
MAVCKFIAAAAAGLLACASARAETDLVLMGKSWHFGHDVPAGETGYNVNQYNWGGGLEYRFTPSGWFVGGLTYHDTFHQQAYALYGGYQYSVPLTDNLSAFAAIRAGYLNGSGWHGPGALPSFGIKYKRVSAEVVYIPPSGKDGYNCIAVFGRIAF